MINISNLHYSVTREQLQVTGLLWQEACEKYGRVKSCRIEWDKMGRSNVSVRLFRRKPPWSTLASPMLSRPSSNSRAPYSRNSPSRHSWWRRRPTRAKGTRYAKTMAIGLDNFQTTLGAVTETNDFCDLWCYINMYVWLLSILTLTQGNTHGHSLRTVI